MARPSLRFVLELLIPEDKFYQLIKEGTTNNGELAKQFRVYCGMIDARAKMLGCDWLSMD